MALVAYTSEPAPKPHSRRRYARLEVVTNDAHETGRTYFVRLRASNGAILMTSETYASKPNAKRALRTVRRIICAEPLLTAEVSA